MSIVKITSVFEIAKRGNIVNPFTIEEAELKLAALREAGEKMAEALRNNKRVVDLGNPNDSWAFIDEDAAALEAWEAANK